MPEIPDLEAIRHYLWPRIEGRSVTGASAPLPWLVRTGAADLATLEGHGFTGIRRTGKFLLFDTDDERILVVNPMLTGRFHWVERDAKTRGRVAVVISFDNDHDLRYSDERRMGRWYLVRAEALDEVPQMAKLGPDVMDLDEDAFVARLMARRGQIKSTLTNQEVIAGIGNAYSDEILWAAGLHPHRKRSTMGEEDVRRLYRAMRSTLDESIETVDARAQAEGLGTKTEWREHLRVHRREGEPCPRCGSTIRGQVRSGSETNYCLTCQPLFS
jgi:formamidopyrimidine-DNA glycosylase